MASGKLNSLSIECAHRFGGPVLLLSDGDGLYFRKQTRKGAAWMFRYRFAAHAGASHASLDTAGTVTRVSIGLSSTSPGKKLIESSWHH